MNRLKILVIFPIMAFIILLNYSKFALSKSIEPANINAARLEDIENAIIIKGIENSPDNSWNESETSNFEGAIIYNDSFNNVELKNKYNKKESYINVLRRQDNKWHLTSHKIKKNENLWSIARKYDTDYRIILKANEINNPNRLNPGRTILVPNKMGIDHRVQKKDTLSEIAKKYGINKNVIISQNNIKKNFIKQGELLFIPDATPHPEKFVNNFNQERNIKDDNNKNYTDDAGTEKADKSEKFVKNITGKFNDRNKLKFSWPLKGSITSAFGKRVDPINNKSKFHCGMDIGADIGTPVRAAAEGETIFSGWKKGYGRVIILKHKDGYITVYAHNKENIVSTGDIVQKGEVIASSGMSGAVTGPHLHFEIRKYVSPLNPYRFLKL
jgi:murein DD-endopeptidase MepM/ murein hydrolase activator NlpD